MAQDICPSAMCTFLPFGFVLLAMDSFHDLRWCLTPSPITEKQLKEYYINILTPRARTRTIQFQLPISIQLPIPIPIIFPGFLFPLYVIYIFVGVCPDWIGWSLLALYVPLCIRYYRIQRGWDNLGGWWMVVGIRVLMGLLTYRGLEERGCRHGDYTEHLSTFWDQQHQNAVQFTI